MSAILFDLDGTLVDTLEDIRGALNHVLELCYCRKISSQECKSVVGGGLRKALISSLWFSRAAFPEDELDMLYGELCEYYEKHLVDHSRPYEGVVDFLHEAKGRGYKLGILSNKADSLVQEIVLRLFEPGLFDFVRGLRPNEAPKPDNNGPEDFLSLCNINVEDVTIVGDSQADWACAGKHGMKAIIVTYGFRTRLELEGEGISPLADSPKEVAKLLWK